MKTNEEIGFQIGKAGLTEGIVQTISGLLKTHKKIRIAVLQSAPEHDREKIKLMCEDLKTRLSYECSTKVIGYTILLRRLSVNPKTGAIPRHRK